MEYKHKLLGIFNVELEGFNYLSTQSALNYLDTMQETLLNASKALALTFTHTGNFTDIKRASYRDLSATVTLAPGVTLVSFNAFNTLTGEGLTRHAERQLREELESEIIKFARANLVQIRQEFRHNYLRMAHNTFQAIQDDVKLAMNFIEAQLPYRPKIGNTEVLRASPDHLDVRQLTHAS